VAVVVVVYVVGVRDCGCGLIGVAAVLGLFG
jgi:hypothetical protein